jgi:NADH:ubiquinone oxidoreductase subunit 4 (subunit M)
MGESPKSISSWSDVAGAARLPILLLIAALMITGFVPGTVLSYVKPSIEALVPTQPAAK